MVEYSALILQYFYNSNRAGTLDVSQENVHHVKAGDRTSPAIMHLYIKLNDRKVIEDTRFLVFGDVAAIATMSWIAEYLIGKHIDEIKDLQSDFIIEQLNLDARHYYCALMAEEMVSEVNRSAG